MKTLNDVFQSVSSFFNKNKTLTKFFSKISSLFGRKKTKSENRVFNVPTPQSKERKKVGGSNNHSVSTPKYRVQMAVASNRINRQRVKRWKH